MAKPVEIPFGLWKSTIDGLTDREMELIRLSIILNLQMIQDPSGDVLQYFAKTGLERKFNE